MMHSNGRYGYNNGNSSGKWIDSNRLSNFKKEIPSLTPFGQAVVKLNKLNCEEDKLCFIKECECTLSEGEIEEMLEMV